MSYQYLEHPTITNARCTGYPDDKEPETPICPNCGEEADTFYISADKEVLGCDNCISRRDAWEFVEEDED